MTDTPSSVPGSGTAFHRLTDLLVNRGFVTREDVESAREAAGSSSAGPLLDALVDRALITPSQRDTVEQLFRDAQARDGENLRHRLVDAGLVSAEQAEAEAQTWRDAHILECTFGAHLVAAGLLSQAQAERVQEPAGGKAFVSASAGGNSGLRKALDAVTARPRLALAGGGGALLLVLVVGLWPGGPVVMPECVMNGYGNGTCTFTNATGDSARGACGFIAAVCGESDPKVSATFCGGELPPRGSNKVEFSVAAFDQISPDYGDWRESCEFDFLPDEE